MARKGKQRIGLDPLVRIKAGGTPSRSRQPADALTDRKTKAGLETAPGENDPKTSSESDSSDERGIPQSPLSIADDHDQIGSLGDALTIPNAEDLREKLEAILDSAEEVLWLNAGELMSVDTAGLQLLSVFAQEARTRGIAVKWRDPPEVLVQGASRLDLEKILHFSADTFRAHVKMTPL